ncbi:MAG: hypothetical protein ABS939_00720 [Psychrobacillus sp.]
MLEKYPRAQQIVEELNYHEYVPTIRWCQLDRETAAISLAKTLLIKQSLESGNIPLIHAARKQVDVDYHEVGDKLHVFAREEGRSQISLTNENVTQLFAHIEIGGSRYRQVKM